MFLYGGDDEVFSRVLLDLGQAHVTKNRVVKFDVWADCDSLSKKI